MISPSTTSELYSTSLPENDIRLLTILPSTETNAPIACELRQHAVIQAVDYEALSYVWGDPNDLVPITCNGVSIQITRKLQNALWRLRDATTSKTIWADALCMNQADTEEKNIHVPLMGRVYSRATNTVVYIGEVSREDADRAKDAMTKVGDFYDSLHVPSSAPADKSVSMATITIGLLIRKLRECDPLDLDWNDIKKFFEATWFERIWCVQEITLARSSGDSSYMMYGPVQIPYPTIIKTTWCFAIASFVKPEFCQELIPPSIISTFIEFPNIEADENYLLELLYNFRDHLATDPRDKIYGLLGILQQRFAFDASALGVGYAKSVTEVYTDAAREILRMGQNLSLLDHVAYPLNHAIENASPSWVPRWDYAADVNSFLATKQNFRVSLTVGASENSEPTSVYKISGNTLLVSGLQYSHITWTSSPLFPANKDTAGADKIPGFRATFLECWRRSQPSRSTCFDNREEVLSLARTFSPAGGIPALEEQPVDEFMADFLAFVHHILDRCCSGCTGRPKDNKYIVKADGTKCTGSQERYSRLFAFGCHGRIFFQTELGTYGVGPDCVREGDMVMALIGGSSPYALRPTPEGYLCLGIAYIDGLMDGTYFKNLLESGVEREQFTLI